MEANAEEYIKNYLHLKRFPRISLHWYLEVIDHTHSGGSIKFVLIFFFSLWKKGQHEITDNFVGCPLVHCIFFPYLVQMIHKINK